MKKLYTTLFLFLTLGLGTAALAQETSIPVTAVSFPKEVIDVNAGKIDFYAKLTGFSGEISFNGIAPYFFWIEDNGFRTYHMGFNSNDGEGNGGLVGAAGNRFNTGTGGFGSWTFEKVLGAGQVAAWHHYVFQWNKDGIPGVDNGTQKVAIFIDGVLNSGRWQKASSSAGTFGALTSCPTLNLITMDISGPLSGQVIMDELKVYDHNNNLVLWNTLGSKSEVEHSAVGLNGSFNGGGNATFVQGISGNAVMAKPIWGGGTPNCDITITCPSNKTVNTDAGACTAVVTGIDPVLTSGGSLSDVRYTLSGVTTGSGTGTASGLTFNKGLTTITYTSASNAAKSCHFTVTVADAEAPVLTSVSVTPSILWPPNHKMIPVTVNYTVTDNCRATASLSVSSNEPPTAPNVQVLDKHHLLLRAERNGQRNARIYVISITALDASGNQTVRTVTVTVPHDMSGITKGNESNNDVEVSAIPNYSQGTFNIILQSQSNKPVNLRVLNNNGSVVQAWSNIESNRSLQIGSNYMAGVYYVEVTQGNRKINVKLVKINR